MSELVMTDCPQGGRRQGHVSNFYILDLSTKVVDSQPVDYTCDGRARDCNPLTTRQER